MDYTPADCGYRNRDRQLAGLLGSCGFEDASRRYLSSFSELLKFAAAIAIENKNIDELFYAVTTAGVSRGDPDNPAELWARSIVETWPEDSEYRINAEELFVRSKLRREGVEFEKDIKTNQRQIHQNILTSAGIDPTAGSWPALINLAIKDQDPTRVLKYYEYKDISRHPLRDRSLDRLALETANPKIIHCQAPQLQTRWSRLRRHRHPVQ